MKTLREQQQAIQQQQIQVQQQAVAVQEQANALKEKELEIKATVPIRVAEISSGSKENIKNREIEHDENKSEIESNVENERLAFQQSMEVLKGQKSGGK
jgi:5-deoxy-D-glucuronate isomerase